MTVSLTIALVMLNAPTLLIIITTFLVFSPLIFSSTTWLFLVMTSYDILRPIIYIWATIVTIQGKQDFFAIAFYILAILQAISIIKKFIGTLAIIFVSLSNK